MPKFSMKTIFVVGDHHDKEQKHPVLIPDCGDDLFFEIISQ